MMWKRIVAFLVSLLFIHSVHSQDTLPDFTVTTKGNGLMQIRWKNNYRNLAQISIQRSHDSIKNFRTLLNVPDPKASVYTYLDTKAPSAYMYYRLFIMVDSVQFFFTSSKKAFWDTVRTVRRQPPLAGLDAHIPPSNENLSNTNKAPSDQLSSPSGKTRTNNASAPVSIEHVADTMKTLKGTSNGENEPLSSNAAKPRVEKRPTAVPPAPKPEKLITIKRRDSIMGMIPESKLRGFIDSLITKTKDTFVLRYSDTLLIKPFIPKEVYKTSTTVFTDKDGNVTVQLPDYNSFKYSIDFFDEKGLLLFAIGHVKESPIIIDKANFLRSGWYGFELKQEGKVKEKNKFFIPRDM